MKTKKVEERKQINLDSIKVASIKISIVGETPLLMEKFSDRTREELKNKVEGKGKEKKRSARNLNIEVEEKIHRLPDGKPGYPAAGFKKAMVEAAVYVDGMNKKLAKGAFQVVGNLIPIKYEKMVINKSLGRDSGINKAPREIWRPEFVKWSCELPITYNMKQITPEEILNLGNLGGFHIGVGGWRPQCNGTYGMFKIK